MVIYKNAWKAELDVQQNDGFKTPNDSHLVLIIVAALKRS